MEKFLTISEAKARIDELSAAITKAGGTPKKFGSSLTNLEAQRAIGHLEGQLEALESGKAAATPPPLPGARAPLSAAAQAMLDAARAKAEAKIAAEKAKTAVAELGKGRQEPFPTCPGNLRGAERREWFRRLNAFGADTAKFASDGYLQSMAASEFSAQADREIAMSELNRRGWRHHPDTGCWSRSQI